MYLPLGSSCRADAQESRSAGDGSKRHHRLRKQSEQRAEGGESHAVPGGLVGNTVVSASPVGSRGKGTGPEAVTAWEERQS